MIDDLRGLTGIAFDEMHSQLQVLHTGCGHDHGIVLAAQEDEFIDLMLDLILQVWAEKGMPEGYINKSVVAAFAGKLWKGVENGYGINFGSVDYDTPDFNMLKSLQENVWHFSAAKNYTQLRELSNALIGPDGKLRTFSEFKTEAYKINDRHVKQYLKAEYELAVAGGQMCSKWVDITSNADTFPLLEYDAVLDKQTTELCTGLNGTLLPIDHSFWKTYYPPNHFNCRSTVRQKGSGKVTQRIPSADIPDMFKTNLAAEGLIYPKGHPYFIDNPREVSDYKHGEQ